MDNRQSENMASETQLRHEIEQLKEQHRADAAERRCVEHDLDVARSGLIQKTHELEQVRQMIDRLVEVSGQSIHELTKQISILSVDVEAHYKDSEIQSFPLNLVEALWGYILDVKRAEANTAKSSETAAWETLSTPQRLAFLMQLIEDHQLYSTFLFFFTASFALSDDSVSLCYQVLRECEVHGAPSMDTLHRLKPWLDTHIPKVKLDTLCNALISVRNLHTSAQSQAEYAKKQGPNTRRLRTYEEWWDIIEAESMRNFETLKRFFRSHK